MILTKPPGDPVGPTTPTKPVTTSVNPSTVVYVDENGIGLISNAFRLSFKRTSEPKTSSSTTTIELAPS